jgi:hypothetical protein
MNNGARYVRLLAGSLLALSLIGLPQGLMAGGFEYTGTPGAGNQSFATKYPTYYSTYSCNSCHTSAPTLNATYGTAYKAAAVALGGRSQANVGPALTNIEPVDSDGDGYKNISEINALKKAYDATDHPTAAVSLSSAQTAKSGAPAGTVSYSVTVTNNGNLTDSFTLGVSVTSGQAWTPSIVGTANSVAAGGSAAITVNVAVSGGAAAGQQSVATVTAASQANPAVTATGLGLTTTATVTSPRYVSASSGTNAGACNNSGSPCRTITYAMTQAVAGDPINVAPGTYNLALGEVFPIVFKSGVQLVSTGNASNTIIDAAGAPIPQSILVSTNNTSSSALIRGFTFRNGLNLAAILDVAFGGAIRVSNSSGTLTIDRNVFSNNEARGYTGPTELNQTGGLAWGGAIHIFQSAVSVTNNVFVGNIARGGNGFNHPGTPRTGNEYGGPGEGGAIYFAGSGKITNNTFYGNLAIGGNGGTASDLPGYFGAGANGAVAATGNPAPSVDNNIFFGNAANSGTGSVLPEPEPSGPGAVSAPNAPSITKNLFHVNAIDGAPSSGDSLGTGAVFGNPSFHSAPGNLRITLQSIAKGAGTATGAPATDHDGVTRPNPPSIGAFEASALLTDSPTDFNDDGRSDILWRNSANGLVFRMLMNGTTRMSEAVAYSEPNLAWTIVADGDFNGDGVTDLLWRNTSTGQVYLMPFSASGFPSGGAIIHTTTAAWKIVSAPDLNGDGKADILWWNSTTGQVYAMIMNGTAITQQGFVYTEPDTAWRIEAVGDLDGDGKQNQLLWRNTSNGQVYLMTVNVLGGGFSQSGGVIYNSTPPYQMIATGDFNGDGKDDILWRQPTTGAVYMMLMNGAAITFEGVVHTAGDLNWKIVAAGDYNGDGKADILWRNESTGMIYMMLMNGPTKAAEAVIYTEPNLSWKVLGPWEYRVP